VGSPNVYITNLRWSMADI